MEQMNNPPLSMITPPRSYSPRQILYHSSNNFESPSSNKFYEYKRKLSAAAYAREAQYPTIASSTPLHNNTGGYNLGSQLVKVSAASLETFDDIPENVALSTP